MNDYDAPKFAETIAALAVATRGELDDPTIELYFRALNDVPMDLLAAAAVELARDATFFPKPSEWRGAVDRVLDRQEKLREIAGPKGQLQLPGEVGAGEDWRCPDCDNTGYVISAEDGACSSPEQCRFATKGVRHTHQCANMFCCTRRRQAFERKRRYSRSEG